MARIYQNGNSIVMHDIRETTNMKFYTSLICGFLFLLGMSSCYDEPDFPMEPRLIDFDGGFKQGIKYKDVPNTIVDSLILRVVFQDGDGNLGLTGDEPSPILREQFIFQLDENGEFVRYDPALEPFDCTRFSYFNIVGRDTIQDTIAIEYNPYYYNFEVGLYVKEDGVFEEFDFRKELCRAPLGGRFPLLKDDFSNTKPLEGVIQYSIASTGLQTRFRNDTLKLTVRIRDRALNESNIIESEAFVWNDIEVPVDE